MAKRKHKPVPPQISRETRAAEMVTVLWMLSAMTTLISEIGLIVALWHLQGHADDQHVAALSLLLWLTAVVVGTVTLVLVPIVLKMRIGRPPPGVTIAAIIIGAAPWAMLLVM